MTAPHIIAVLDWELSTLGDPLADFAYHLMQWHMPHSESRAGTGSLVGLDLQALGLPSLSDYVDLYVARTGLDPRPHLPAYLAYNFFRIAAILQGIIGRVRDGTATSDHAPAKADDDPAARRDRLALRAGSGRAMKSVALALGGGGARGLAHIAVFETLDEMGIRPVAIAGTSIGALLGARLCLRHERQGDPHACHGAGERSQRIVPQAAGRARRRQHRLADRVRLSQRHPDRCREILRAVPARPRCRTISSALAIPLTVIASDLYARRRGRDLVRTAESGGRSLDGDPGREPPGAVRRPRDGRWRRHQSAAVRSRCADWPIS